MKKENDELFDMFRVRLEHAELNVRENLWEQLEHNIPVALRSRRRLIIQRFSAAASVILILAGVSTAFWHFSPKDEIADAFTHVETSTITPGNTASDVVVPVKEETAYNSTQSVKLQPATVIRPVSAGQTTVSEEKEVEESFSFSFSVSISIDEETEMTHENHSSNRLAGGVENSRNYQQEQQTTAVSSAGKSAEEKKNSWAVSLYTSTDILTAKENSNGLQMFTKKDNPLNITNTPGMVSHTDFYSQAQQRTSVKHKMPLTVGLAVQKELSERLALETGLIYTQLNSELTGGEGTYYQQEQKLHYVGIPLKANYTLHNDKRFRLYTTAGGTIEKCVSGKVKTDYFDEEQKTHTTKHSLKPSPLQVSLAAALGIQCKLNERLSVYAEPGVTYYFDDGSAVSTIRKEKPVNLSLLCGVRMTY